MGKSARKIRIGISGGSFNPIHNGHLLMAELARERMGLDRLIFMPVWQSPGKPAGTLADGRHRWNMIKRAIRGNTYFSASDWELKRKGISYTIDSLRHFRQLYPDAELFWLIGEDNIERLPGWKDFLEIIQLASFIAVSRKWFNISSSEIRQRLQRKQSIRYFTPDAVIDYIEQHRLYH